jgi:hypothetical protein
MDNGSIGDGDSTVVAKLVVKEGGGGSCASRERWLVSEDGEVVGDF